MPEINTGNSQTSEKVNMLANNSDKTPKFEKVQALLSANNEGNNKSAKKRFAVNLGHNIPQAIQAININGIKSINPQIADAGGVNTNKGIDLGGNVNIDNTYINGEEYNPNRVHIN